MHVTAIHVYQRDLPVAGGTYRMANTSVSTLDTTIVELVSDKGLSGWGETCPVGPLHQPHHALGARAALAELAPALVGVDPYATGPAWDRMEEHLNGHDYAKAALEMALWDLVGRDLRMSVSDLLGGRRMARVPAYYAVGVGDRAECVDVADDKAREGFGQLQIKLGGRPVETDIDTMHAVYDAVGGRVRLAADANRSWSTRDALLFSNACADLPIVVEQPCATLDEIIAIRSQLRHPVYLDENAVDLAAVLRAIASGACDGFAFKLTRTGGIGPMRAIRDVCAARCLPYTCNDAWGGDIVSAACVHVAATASPRLLEGSWIAAPHIGEHYDGGGGIAIRDGAIEVPTGPGLGLAIDPELFGEPVASYG